MITKRRKGKLRQPAPVTLLDPDFDGDTEEYEHLLIDRILAGGTLTEADPAVSDED